MPPHHLTRWTDKALTFALQRSGVSQIQNWHETVAPYHADQYRTTLGMFAFRSLLGQANRLYADDILSRLMRRLLRIKTLGDKLSTYGDKQFPQRGRGHTVCVVGEKAGRLQ